MRLLKANEIEVKVKQVKENGCVALLYKTARTDMDVLDEEYGAENWQDSYEEIKGNMYCKIGVWNEKLSQWIWKQDCGIESREDDEGNQKKGEASDAFKRAGFKWGIGRELYTAPFIWISSDFIQIKSYNGKYSTNEKFSVKKIEYNDNREIIALEIVNSKNKVVYTFGTKTPIVMQKKDDFEEIKPVETERPDNWLSVAAFRGICERTSDISEIRSVLQAQKGNPNLQEMINIATIRKQEILDMLQG